MQVNGRNHHLATGQPAESWLTSLRQACEAAAALAQSQLQQKIMTAANDCRRGSPCEGRSCDQPCHHPSVESSARKQPTSSDLGTWCRPFREKLVKLALRKAEVSRGLVGGQQVGHAIHMNLDAHLTITARSAKDQ